MVLWKRDDRCRTLDSIQNTRLNTKLCYVGASHLRSALSIIWYFSNGTSQELCKSMIK